MRLASADMAAPAQNKLLLALDLSTQSSGWALKDLKTQELVDYGCITSSKKDAIVRITEMRSALSEILSAHPSIQKVIAEEVRLDNLNLHTQKLLTYTQFALIDSIYQTNPEIKYEFIQPSSWRSKIGIKTGRGIKRAELKKKDIEYVKDKYNIEVNDDIADAIGIADSYFIAQAAANQCAW